MAETVDEFGPKVFDDFNNIRLVPSSAIPAPADTNPRLRRRKGGQGDQGLLSHPFEWLDDTLFGWSQYRVRSRSSSEGDDGDESPSGYRTEEDADYEEVIGFLPRDGDDASDGLSSSSRKRRLSRSARSRSNLDLNLHDDTERVTASGFEANGNAVDPRGAAD